jgi:glycosyltransferase involved in cell wall biosynthesis
MLRRACLLTQSQPCTNPRLVKEADALSAAGFDVTVVYSYCVDWADAADAELFRSRSWKALRVGGDPRRERLKYFYARVRYRIGREIANRISPRLAPWNWTLSRTSPELIAAAKRLPAELYIAHTAGALPAAIAGAKRHAGRAGFDAEDFHSEMIDQREMTPADTVVEQVEARYLPKFDYRTAAAPAIAQAYALKYRIEEPVCLLNVFPLSERPAKFRRTSPSGPLTLYWFSQTIGCGRGIEDAIQAMGMLRSQKIELYLHGTWAPGYQEAIYRLVETLGLQRRQVIHVDPEAPADLIRRASTYDVGLALEQAKNRNRDISLTNKIFTYILAGNAVAATVTVGQQPVIERIAPGGVSYAIGDVAGLAGLLKRWLDDREALEIARRTAWDWGTREFNWDLEKEKFLAVVSRAVFQGSPVRWGTVEMGAACPLQRPGSS